MTTEVIDGKAVTVYDQPQHEMTLFGQTDEEMLASMTSKATILKKIVDDKKLATKISNRDHVRFEGWSTLGSLVGVFPVLDGEPEQVEINGSHGWKATFKAVTRAGEVVGRASAFCLHSEANWKNKDEFQLSSMAQTRAASKALKMPLGFIMTLAGFEPTPAEEMVENRQKEKAASIYDNLKATCQTLKEQQPDVYEQLIQTAVETWPYAKSDSGRIIINKLTGKDAMDMLEGMTGYLKPVGDDDDLGVEVEA